MTQLSANQGGVRSIRCGNIRSQSGEFVGNRVHRRVLGNSEVDKTTIGEHIEGAGNRSIFKSRKGSGGWQGPSHWSRAQFRILGIRKETD